jgi:glycosyltransferase involved in cell wall biosynthesis
VKKILLISEFINPPYDEGIKKTAFKVFNDLKSNFDVKVICRYGFKHKNIHIVKTNKLFLSFKIAKIIKDFSPNLLIYLPFQSSTFASFIRLKILSSINYPSKTILFALQPKINNNLQNYFINFLKPSLAITPSLTLSNTWNLFGIKNHIVPLSTNVEVFKPVNKNKKNELRKKYGLDKHEFIASHMGHLNEKRNLEALIPLQKSGIQVIVVTSTSSPKSPSFNLSLKQKLQQEGIIVYDHFIERIEEIYQMSDTYVFPVIDQNASIGMPLSILEARACGISVVSTDYGSVNFFFGDDFGAIKYSNPNNLLENCNYFKSKNQLFTESKVRGINNLFYDLIKKLI